MKTLVMTGGGTAGHVTPCLALVPAMKKQFDTILFIGGTGMEKELVEGVLPFYSVPSTKFYRKEIWKNARIPSVLIRGINASKKILSESGAAAVFSKGGFAALPACLAAKSLGIPVVCHESDYSLGLANRITAKFAKAVLTSFIETKGGTYVGNPVREEILRGDGKRAALKYGVKTKKPVLLVVGGSTGSEAINDAIDRSIDRLTESFFVVHLRGRNNLAPIKHSDYLSLSYAEDIADLYDLSAVVVTRGGSNALSELAAVGKRAVVIPLPKGNSRGDQVQNALSYQRKGFFFVLPQEELTPQSLISAVERAFLSEPKRSDPTGVNERIASIVGGLAK